VFIAGYDLRSILPLRSENNRVRGNMKYLHALMDDESRFWIANEVSDTKYHANVHELFKQGRKVTGKASFLIITDGAPNFRAGIESELWGEKKQLALVHERGVRFGGEIHNNKMERMNGELRDRLEGKTPPEKAGIQVKGSDKWLTLIQNASKEKR